MKPEVLVLITDHCHTMSKRTFTIFLNLPGEGQIKVNRSFTGKFKLSALRATYRSVLRLIGRLIFELWTEVDSHLKCVTQHSNQQRDM